MIAVLAICMVTCYSRVCLTLQNEAEHVRTIKYKRLLLSAVSVVATLSCLEWICYYFLYPPGHSPNELLKGFLRLAYFSNRDLIQYNSACARYDSELTYTLRPGACVFRNSEFSHTVYINSVGLRDDEESLREPQIIVLGDSHAMGWGVEEDKTFSRLVESDLGLRILNAGISSYGTAREVLMLRRLDTSKLKLLVIQYCSNDWAENAYYQAHGSLDRMSQSRYSWIVDDISTSKRYRLGQYLGRIMEVHVLRRIAHKLSGERIPFPTGAKAPPSSGDEEAEFFLDIIRRSDPIVYKVPILLLEIDGYGISKGRFMKSMEEYARNGTIAQMKLDIRLIDLSVELKPIHFFTIDDHLNTSGHGVVAGKLSKSIQAALASEK